MFEELGSVAPELKKERVTIRTVARVAGVSRMTVSRVLRNDPAVRELTAEHVRKVVKELDYRPNPLVSTLMRQVTRGPVTATASIAYVTEGDPNRVRHCPITRRLYDGARTRAETLGFQVDHIDLGPKLAPAKLPDVLAARGIHGVVLHATPPADAAVNPEPLLQKGMAVAGVGGLGVSDRIHTADSDRLRSTIRFCRELYARGYRRFGWAIPDDDRSGMEMTRQMAYTWFRECHPQVARIPVLRQDVFDIDGFRGWFDCFQPDVVISRSGEVYQWLREIGQRIPTDTGWFCPDLPPGETKWSGILENHEAIAEAAVDMVEAQIHRNEVGPRKVPHLVLIDGQWVEGETIRPREGA